MPVTSLDIPNEMMEYLERITEGGKTRSKRNIVLEALEAYRKFTMHEWQDSYYHIRGFRYGFVSRRALEELLKNLTDEQAYEAGKRAGRILKDCCLATLNFDTTNKKNWSRALQIVTEYGWGQIQFDEHRIVVQRPFLGKRVLHGYLEAALGVQLSEVKTEEDVAIFAFE